MDGRVLILFSSSDEDDDELRDRLPLLEVVTKAWLVEKLLDGDEIEGDEIGGLALSTGLPLLPVTGCRSAQVSAPLRWKIEMRVDDLFNLVHIRVPKRNLNLPQRIIL